MVDTTAKVIGVSGLRNTSKESNNPKHAVGMTKVPLSLIPPVAKLHLALALNFGAFVRGYGPYNWRASDVNMRIYIEAAERHLDCMLDGEMYAQDSGVLHAAHVMACMAIIIDAMSLGRLIDDRPVEGRYAELLEYHNNRLKEQINVIQATKVKAKQGLQVRRVARQAKKKAPASTIPHSVASSSKQWGYVNRKAKSGAVLQQSTSRTKHGRTKSKRVSPT